MSEKMDPQALLDWLNVYMEAMAQLVMDHGDVVDNYIGNSIKADFGVPVPRTDESCHKPGCGSRGRLRVR